GTGAPAAWQEKIRRQTLSSRWGTPEEIASVAAFLASPAAGYVNGQIIDVNGGFAVR
ncbi:MAG: SDR family oxidoreductase, partial [Thermoguttaceae bacterium]|nr:SDR family oxidoreductase [Thermoguttaceae bacterium]